MSGRPRFWLALPGRRGLFLFGAVIVAALAILAIGTLVRDAELRAAMVRADPDAIRSVPALRDAALATGRPLYRAYCAACHGSEGEGRSGVPSLRDHDWLYGQGRVSEIESIVRYGIRSRNAKGWNLASMPAYASAHPYAAEPIPPLSPAEVGDVVQLLLRYESRPADAAAAARGLAVYQKGGCWDCHGPDGYGDPAVGAPDLRDTITLYGGSRADLTRTVEQGRRGVSPAFAKILDLAQTRAVAVYVAALSGTGPDWPVKARP